MRSLHVALATLTLAAASLAPSRARAEERACWSAQPANTNCWVQVSDLHPTQLTYGAIEVQRRAIEIAQRRGDDLMKYLKKHSVTMVIGPGGYYITDGHHVAIAYASVAGANALVYAQVVANWSAMTPDAFWAQMQASGFTASASHIIS